MAVGQNEIAKGNPMRYHQYPISLLGCIPVHDTEEKVIGTKAGADNR
jgi:hypothetical protein